MTLEEEIVANREQAIAWLTGTLALLSRRDEYEDVGDEIQARFYTEAAASAVMSLNLKNSHVAISLMLEMLAADFKATREQVR